MFDSLKKKLKDGVRKLTAKVAEEPNPLEPSQPAPPVLEQPGAPEPPKAEKKTPEPLPEPPAISEPEELAPEPEGAGPEAVEPARPPDAGSGLRRAGAKKRFGFLRRKKVPEPAKPALPATPEPQKEKRRLLARITEKTLSAQDIDAFFDETEPELLRADVAVEVCEALRASLKSQLAAKPIKRSEAQRFIQQAFEAALLEVVDQGSIDLEALIAARKPRLLLFLGFNGAGKTTSIAKLGRWLLDRNHPIVLAAGDTFRAAAIDQLQHHGDRLGVKTVAHDYGADAAAVIFDAVKHAEAKHLHAVLADTAGRTHVDTDLLNELKKVIRVNKPDLRILVVDSLTGNDAVEQARKFHESVGVDAVFLTKADVNKKGGALLSVAYAIKKPVLFLGTGQGYGDIQKFDPAQFVKQLIES